MICRVDKTDQNLNKNKIKLFKIVNMELKSFRVEKMTGR